VNDAGKEVGGRKGEVKEGTFILVLGDTIIALRIVIPFPLITI